MSVFNVNLGEDQKINLILGQQGENAVTSVVFDFSAWSTAFGSGTLSLSVQRPGDALPYAVVMTVSGTDATWEITDLDTAYKGTGEIQLKYTVGTKVKKSVVHKFTVYRSLGENGEYPSPGQTWQEEIEDELADVKSDLNVLNDDLSDLIHEMPTGINLFDGNFDESGYIASGADTASANYKRTSRYYPIIGNSTGKLYGYLSASASTFAMVFYDANKTFLANKTYNNVTTKATDIPSGAVYFRCYVDATWEGNATFALTYVSSYTPYTYKYVLNDEIVGENNLTTELQEKINDVQFVKEVSDDLLTTKIINIFDGTFPNDGYFDANGADASSSSYQRTDYIEIDNTNSTLYFLRSIQPYQLSYCFYDANKTYINGRANVWGDAATGLTQQISIPQSAVYLRMYCKKSAYSGTLMLSYVSESEYISYGEQYYLKDELIDAENLVESLRTKMLPFYGKKIAFMGDSIIGNFYDSTGVCSLIAEKTGATVINCAFGGTRMAYEYSQYGDATPGATGYIDGATDQEKNQVDQYRYWNTLSGYALSQAIATGSWIAQDTAVANMASGLDYFAQRLAEVKAVDWSTIDFIMWEYGTNDFMSRVKLEDSSDVTNMFAYSNAYRSAIETILTEYPNIRVVPVTPMYRWYRSGGAFTNDSNTHTENDYTGTSHKLTDFVSMAQDISREYQLPCIDNYYTLGANKFTRLSFFNSTDGTHPNANGRLRIAEHVASQLDSVV